MVTVCPGRKGVGGRYEEESEGPFPHRALLHLGHFILRRHNFLKRDRDEKP